MRALALALALAPAIALGQLSVTATPMVRLGGVEGLRVIGDIPLIPAAATLTQSPVALVEIETQAKNITVEVTDQKRLPVQFQQVDADTVLLSEPGRVWVDVTALDFEANIYARRTIVVEVGDAPEPDEPDDPDPHPVPPDVPDDEFDNIGKRVAGWTEGLQANEQFGKLYLKYADVLRATPSTVSQIFAAFNLEAKALNLGDGYEEARNAINAEVQQRWPMSKPVLADFFTAIAAGLGVQR